MKIELQPVSSVSDIENWHHLFELIAIFRGVCAIDEIEWDDDQILASYLDTLDDFSIRSDYEAERNAGIQAAKDYFISEVMELIRDRQEELGIHSPFDVGDGVVTVLARKEMSKTTISSLAYACLAIFWSLASSTDLVVISKADRDAFVRDFSKIFEYICCIVMAGRHPSAVWYFGDSRDVREFLRRLESVVHKAGSGVTKNFDELEENQTGANDAGIDVMSITTRNDLITRDATAYLVGATIQKSDRRNKIIGIDQIRRFTGYFDKGPKLQYSGVLAIPYIAKPAEQLTCRDINCAYLSKDEIIQNLALLPSDTQRLFYIQRPRRLLIRASRKWQKKAMLSAREGEIAVLWG